jgi:hypothetical protein
MHKYAACTPLNIHPPPLHVDPSGPGRRRFEGLLAALRDCCMQDAGYGLPRIYILGRS